MLPTEILDSVYPVLQVPLQSEPDVTWHIALRTVVAAPAHEHIVLTDARALARQHAVVETACRDVLERMQLLHMPAALPVVVVAPARETVDGHSAVVCPARRDAILQRSKVARG